MSDILKFLREELSLELDPDGNLLALNEWSEEKALTLAKFEKIEITDEHWEVIHYIRDYFRDHGMHTTARSLIHVLEQKFDIQGGKKYLYGLFPKGPVSQGSRIAGLPLPAYSSDPSFGTVH